MGQYIAQGDIQAAMSTEDYVRLFDRNSSGNAPEILAFTNACIATAESLANMTLAGKFPIPLPATVDQGIKQCVIWIACSEASRLHPSFGIKPTSPYQAQRVEAFELLRRLARDFDLRPVTSPAGLAQPVASVINPQNSVGDYNDPYNRLADGEDTSGF